MKRCAVILLILPLLAAGTDQTIVYRKLNPQVLESRLELSPHDAYDRAEHLKHLFLEGGCGGGQLQEQTVAPGRPPNVICTLTGRTDAVIVVGAHFDPAAGAPDNWSGVALLPSLLQSINRRPRRHTFVFVAFTDKAKSLAGSRGFLQQLTQEQKRHVRTMVNLDALALGPAQVWTSRSDPTLVGYLTTVAKVLELPLAAANAEKLGSPDSDAFVGEKIPSVTVYSDGPAAQADEYYKTYQLVAGYLCYLDEAELPVAHGKKKRR